MKRIIALTLAVLMIAALFCACGEKKKSDDGSNNGANTASTASNTPKEVKTTVEAKYDKGFAENYAKSVTTDDNGNKVYEFDGNSYENYTRDYNNTLSAEITNDLIQNHDANYGQFAYLNNEKRAAVIGLNPGQYDEAVAAQEAESIAQNAILYFKGIYDDVDTVSVIYCNANDQNEVYGSFEFAAN